MAPGPIEDRAADPSNTSGLRSEPRTLKDQKDHNLAPKDQNPEPPQPQGLNGQGSGYSEQDSQQPPAQSQQVTVETETVPTVPILGVLNPGLPSNSLKVRRSQESVPRPPSARGSQKKRSQRMAQGSKADFFAAKVADAVDEHDSTSGDETFVYDTAQQNHPPQTNYSDTLRRPYVRSTSDVSFYSQHNQPSSSNLGPASGYSQHPSSPYFGDDSNYESDADSYAETNTTNANINNNNNNGKTNTSQNSNISPFRAPGMRQMVVPKYDQGEHANNPASINNSARQRSEFYDDGHWFPGHQTVSSQHSNQNLGSRGYAANRASFMNHQRRSSRNRSDTSPQRDPNDSIRAKHSYLQRWRVPAQSSSQLEDVQSQSAGTEDDERSSLLRGRPSLYNYHSSLSANGRRWNAQVGLNPSNRENDSGSPQDYSPSEITSFTKFHSGVSMTTRIVICVVLVLILILSMLLVGGIVLAAGQPLSDFDVVSLSDVLVSDRELVFSLVTRARNPGIFSRSVYHSELDVFATTAHAKKLSHGVQPINMDSTTRTVLLGNVSKLESPMIFEGGFSSKTQWHTAAAKLVNPLGNKTELWTEISGHDFDLTVKGVLKYKVLGNEYRESVSRAYHVMAPSFYDDFHEL